MGCGTGIWNRTRFIFLRAGGRSWA
jgi:hypothetical protein